MNSTIPVLLILLFTFLSPTQSSIFPLFITEPYYSIDEGVPFVQQNSTHWFVKSYLPDVKESDFKISVNDSLLSLAWTDNKEIKYHGRIFKSGEEFKKILEIPSEISASDVTIHWEKNVAVVTVPKPHQPIDEICDNLSDGTLMRMKVPEDGDHSVEVKVIDNHLAVIIEASGQREHGEGENKYHSTFHNKIQRLIPIPDGIDAEDIDKNIENGELVVSIKDFPTISG